MRYEDVYGKHITLTDPRGQPVQAIVDGYMGKEHGVTFKLLVSDWHLNSDHMLSSQLLKQGWKLPEITVTDVRDQEMRRLAGQLSGKPQLPAAPPAEPYAAESSARQIVTHLLDEHCDCTCHSCGGQFDYCQEPEAGMGYILCPACGEPCTQEDCR